jgi:hypothetical protein
MDDLILLTDDLINDIINVSRMARALCNVYGVESTSDTNEMLGSPT